MKWNDNRVMATSNVNVRQICVHNPCKDVIFFAEQFMEPCNSELYVKNIYDYQKNSLLSNKMQCSDSSKVENCRFSPNVRLQLLQLLRRLQPDPHSYTDPAITGLSN